MGCCNKRIEEVPIPRVRYWAGTLVMGLVLLGFFVLLSALVVVRPHYRRIRPFYREYARDVWGSILRRERIAVGTAPPGADCTLDARDG